MLITRNSMLSKKNHTLDIPVDEETWKKWSAAPWCHIQDAFPGLSADHREFLLTGITPEEWAESIGDGEDEEGDNDEQLMKMLGGAHFAPGSKLTLPSGKEIDGSEAQALTSFYAPDAEEGVDSALRGRLNKLAQRWIDFADWDSLNPLTAAHHARARSCAEQLLEALGEHCDKCEHPTEHHDAQGCGIIVDNDAGDHYCPCDAR